jgi:hypothetical protein
MIPGYRDNLLSDYLKLRMYDTSAFYAISDRISLNDNSSELLAEASSTPTPYRVTLFRGDCYIC